MSHGGNMRFTLPQGFVKEAYDPSVSTHDKSLYLIQVPKGFDINKLDGQSFNKHGETTLLEEAEDNLTAVHRLTAPSAIDTGIRPLILGSSKNKAKMGKQVKHLLTVVKSYKVNAKTEPETPIPSGGEVPMPEGLRVRFTPFGAGTPLSAGAAVNVSAKKKKKGHKRSHSSLEDSFTNTPHKKIRRKHSSGCDAPDNVFSSPYNKMKHLSNGGDGNESDDLFITQSAQKHKKYKKHKRRSEEILKIKTEPEDDIKGPDLSIVKQEKDSNDNQYSTATDDLNQLCFIDTRGDRVNIKIENTNDSREEGLVNGTHSPKKKKSKSNMDFKEESLDKSQESERKKKKKSRSSMEIKEELIEESHESEKRKKKKKHSLT